jgi:hypothetical protein
MQLIRGAHDELEEPDRLTQIERRLTQLEERLDAERR